jgi:hypothetical protein
MRIRTGSSDGSLSPRQVARHARPFPSRFGAFDRPLKSAPIRNGNLEVYWPEGNILLSGSAIEPDSMEPDDNMVVTLEEKPSA